MSRKERADLSLVGAEDDVEVPKSDLVSRPPAATPPEAPSNSEEKSVTEETRLATSNVGIVLNSRIVKLAEQFRPEEVKQGIHFRVPPWLARMIDQHIYQLKAQGSKITKDALAQDAFMKYFGVNGPPQ